MKLVQWTVWVFVVAGMGCVQGTPCDPSVVPTTCVGGGYCHPELKVCVVGGGGGTTGGGAGGGGGGAAQPFCSGVVESSCEAWQECAPDADGGSCQSQGFTLEWLTPAAQSAHKTATVSGVVRVTKADGGVVELTEVPVQGATGGRFLGGNGSFSGTLELTGADGEMVFSAGWPVPGPDAGLRIRKDTTAPGVTVEVLDRPTALGDADPVAPGSWKKDEWALVKVTVDGGAPAVASNIVTDWDGGVVAAATGCGACVDDCRCFAVDLAGSTLAGLRGVVPLRVEGVADEAQNVAEGATTAVAVTRVKWARQLGTASRLAPVAVSPEGHVVAAYEAGLTSAVGLAVFKQDGGSAWPSPTTTGAVTAGPAVSNTTIWVATNNGVNSQMVPFSLSTGTAGSAECIAVSATAGAFAGDFALVTTDAGVQLPLGVRSGEVQALVANNCRLHTLVSPTPTDIASRSSLAAVTRAGSVEAFVAYEGDTRLWKASLTGTSWAGSGSAILPNGTQPRGLFADGVAFAGGGGGVAGNGALFAVSSSGTLSGNITSNLAAANASAPAVGDDFVVYGNTGGDLFRASYAAGLFSAPTSVALGQGNLQGSMPLIGARGLVYVVAANGTLVVRRAANLTNEWSGPIVSLTGSGNVSQLALDTLRGAAGVKDCSRPLGVLYAVTRSSSQQATLHAILVDSQGLDSTARWPKYQRDNANTGNGTGDLSPWTCP